MRKIPTIFKRHPERHFVIPEINPACQWVFDGEGVALQKVDGTCCMVKNGVFYKRYELKAGKQAPADFIPAQEPDAYTGDTPGWVPVTEKDKWHIQGYSYLAGDEGILPDGTYELIGPKIQGNPEGEDVHTLIRHRFTPMLLDAPRTYTDLDEYLSRHDIEGIVWWRDPTDEDCEKAKIKARDFGFKRGIDAPKGR